MLNPTDLAYFERRAREERSRATAAKNHCAANMHRDLAREYERRAEALTSADYAAVSPAE